MSLWFLILFSLFAVGKSQPTNQINQTDLQAAMSDMRLKSYYGFVILLKILNSSTLSSLQSGDITFFMPNDPQLSEAAVSPDRLQDFILSHSIPTALVLNNLLHFPTGTMVPSGLTNRMISVTNNGRSGLFMNNARIVAPNVCASSMIKCHGISTIIEFDDIGTTSPETLPAHPQNPTVLNSPDKYNRAKSSSMKLKRDISLH